MPTDKSYAVIAKSQSKKQPFKVSYHGANGEKIATSELLTTKWAARNNVVAYLNSIEIFGAAGNSTHRIKVVDRCGKKEVISYVWNDGHVTEF